MQYREKIYREYGIIFGDGETESESESEADNDRIGTTIADKYGWYIMIHKVADGDFLKIDKVTKAPITAALNWMSYTKEIELEQQRNNKS